jgi:hypothetical protein
MRNPFTKVKLLFRRQNRATATTTSETVPLPGARDGPSPETADLDRPQQQLDSSLGNDTAAETATIDVPKDVSEQSHADLPIVRTATLESMPAELRCEILAHLSDLEDLRALVLASPVFYQQYLLDRKALLGRVLKTTLGDYLVDAYAVQTSAPLYDSSDYNHPLQPEVIRNYLNDYVALRTTASPDSILEECAEEDLLDMAGFYHGLARPLVLQFAALFYHALGPSLAVGDLSPTEHMRFLRALYRFQLHCNLFGEGPGPGYRGVADIEPTEKLALFFCSFQPWEVEEMDCIYTLMIHKYDEVFDAIQWDVCRDHPKFKDWRWPYTPPGSFDLNRDGCELLETNPILTLRGHPNVLEARCQCSNGLTAV